MQMTFGRLNSLSVCVRARVRVGFARLRAAFAQVPTVDLHTAIVQKCGPVPQKACFGKPDCFSPHCGGTATHIPGKPTEGYYWLAQSIIQPAMEKLLNA